MLPDLRGRNFRHPQRRHDYPHRAGVERFVHPGDVAEAVAKLKSDIAE
jgi:hypothetical protein